MISSYYSTKRSPWAYKNVTTVKDALTSAEALKAAKLDFDVLQEPVFDENGNALEDYRLNRKSDDGTILGLVTPRYKVVQNTEAFAFVDGLIGESCHYENAGSANNFRLVWLQVKLQPRVIMGDSYDNYLFFKNSFDGKGAVKVCVTPVRIACDNMLNLAIRRAKRVFSIRHTGDIAGKIAEADRTLELSQQYLTEELKKCEATAYAAEQDVYISKFTGYCRWWTRTSVSGRNDAAFVDSEGSLDSGYSSTYSSNAVRPAMRIRIAE